MGDLAPWQRKCSRCSMLVEGGSQICRLCFDERAKAVYWDKAEACRAGGPNRAECLLETGHDGAHEGNGFDDYGPMYRRWADRQTRAIAKLRERGK